MATSSPPPARAALLFAFAIVYVVWGSTYLGIRFAIESMPPLLMASARHLLAGLLLYGFMRARGAPKPTPSGWGSALVIGVCLLTIGNGGVTLGEQYIPSGLAALLAATVPMFLTLFSWLSGMSSRPKLGVMVGLGLGLTGVYLLASTSEAGHVALPGHETLGVACVLTAALLWSIGSLYSKKKQPSPSPFVAGSMQMICGGLVMLVAALLHGEASSFTLTTITAKSWVAFGYLVVFGSIMGFSAYIWLLRAVEPTLAGTNAFVNPVVAVLLGWAFADEPLNKQMLGGAALIVVAVVLVVLGGRTKKPQEAAALRPQVEA
ncbi:drug/metabolite exporter YedA [Hymenobacter sp. GOD-10R]|uniref:drug/metabolite exporter YedA n=1 Tax=Hymenobacter sp. GOD-10R TaxID=3093922 RepID=UPI002D794CE0|nr:drug/metabolite exporter YedA [Hymenobacter sp. GOD-10R]WRQ28977.1 drug/metabolite exporter YedA [Hymenobacter sp. GOD-10R]